MLRKIALLSTLVLLGLGLAQIASPAQPAEAGGIIFYAEGDIADGADTYFAELQAGLGYEIFVSCPAGSDGTPVIDIFYGPVGTDWIAVESYDTGLCTSFGASAFFVPEYSGTYSFNIFDGLFGTTDGRYTVMLVEAETTLNVTGSIDASNPTDTYEIDVPANARLSAAVVCPPPSALDPVLTIYNSAGDVVFSNDNRSLFGEGQCRFASFPLADALVDANTPYADTYTVEISAVGSDYGEYRLVVAVSYGISAPNLGLVQVPVGTVGYISEGGEVYGDFVNDVDGNGFDVMQIASIGEDWYGLWVGSTNYIWVPASAVTRIQ